MDKLDTAIAKFLAEAEFNLSQECVAHVSGLRDGSIGLAARVVLVPASMESQLRRRKLDLGTVGVFETVVPANEVRAFLGEVGNGRLARAQWRDAGEAEITFPKLTAWMQDVGATRPPERAPDSGFEAIVLRLSADDMETRIRRVLGDEKLRAIERLLPSDNPPYSGMKDLCQDWSIGSEIDGEYRTSIDLVSPFWARLTSWSANLESRIVTVSVESKWDKNPDDAVVAVIPRAKAASSGRQSRRLSDSAWRQTAAETNSWETSFEAMPNVPGPIDIILSCGGHRLQEVETGLPNPRITTHLLLDRDFRLLREHLYGWYQVRGNARIIEQGVTELLNLCGFSATHTGGFGANHLVDVIAFLGDRRVAAIECTVTSPPTSKLRDLLARTQEIRNALMAAGQSLTHVTPVVVVPLPSSEIHVPLAESPDEESVRILSREDLERLLEMARRGYPPREIYQVISSVMWFREPEYG